MRILHAIRSANPAGGGPIESIVQADRVLRPQGHQSVIACLDSPNTVWLPTLPVPCVALGPAYGKFNYSPKWVPWLREHLTEFDAVLVHGLWLYPSLGVWRARRPETPYFVYAHGMLDPAFRRIFPVRHFAKTLVWKLWEWRVVRDAAAIIFTCEEECRLARHSFHPYRAREAIVPYCVGEPPGDPVEQRAVFEAAFPSLKGTRTILFLSRIHPKKGCDVLLEAFRRVAASDSRLRLVMAGPDPIGWRASLEHRARQLGIADRVVWTGMLTGDWKWGAFRHADVFILPSHQENFGIAVVEALACGVPALITRRINIWREIEQAEAGFAVDTPTVAAITQLLEAWLHLAPDQAAARRKAARECFLRRFRADVAGQRLLETLRSFGAKG